MEEELNYASVVFRNGNTPPKEPENTEDATVYSTVKTKEPTATQPKAEAAVPTQHCRLLLVCLGLLCLLLVACIIVIIIIAPMMMDKNKKCSNLTAENNWLMIEKSALENKTEELRRDRDELNWTLSVIMKFDTFPVNKFCPEKKCQPCQAGWILFQGNCYLFYEQNAPWMTWNESQKFCQKNTSNLAVIESPQVQEFLSNHTKYYYDKFHGYWFGLSQKDNKWLWVDGRNLTQGYWMIEQLADSGPCAMIIPSANRTANWDEVNCEMKNKFICEGEALIRAPVS